MKRSSARVVESNIPAAEQITREQFGSGNYTPQQRREMDDLTAWMEDQEEEEIRMLTQEMANKNNREARRRDYY